MNTSDTGLTDDNGLPKTTPVRDDKYFFDDGDCLFLVAGVFFKLHKLFLCRDPESMFRGMFSTPQGRTNQSVNLEPIQLSGDSAGEFRSFCWAIYALPDEMHLQTTSNADIPRLVNVAKMCHKYSLPVFENWALEMISIQGGPAPSYLGTCSPEMLAGLVSLAVQCDHSRLLAVVEENWLSRIRTGLPCTEALFTGEIHGRRQFLVDVYYHLHKELCTTSLSPVSAFSQLRLTEKQLLRLLSGHTLLLNFWDHLRQDPPGKLPTCTSHNYCLAVWNQVPWRAEEKSDVVAGMRSMATHFANGNYYLCLRQHFSQAVSGFNVADYFFRAEDVGI